MRNGKLLIGIVTVAVLVATIPLAEGSLLSKLTALKVNQLEDNDFESLILDVNVDGIVDVGDRFLGVYKVQGYDADVGTAPGVQNLAGTDRTITALFLLECLRKETPGLNDPVEIFFGPLQSGGANAAIAEWNTTLAGLGVDTTGILPTDNGTMAVLFDHSYLDGANEATGAFNTSVDAYTGNGLGVSANKLYEAGFTGNPVAVDQDVDGTNDATWGPASEFWITAGPAGTDDTTQVSITGARNLIAMNNLVVFPAGIPLLPHMHLAALDMAESTAYAVGHDWQGEGGFLLGTSPGDFAIATDTDLYIKPIPEPISLAIWAGIIGLGCAVALRRRR